MALITPAYHFGMVVDDVESTMDELGRVLGLTWGRVQRKSLILETSAGPRPTDVCYVYSLEGPPYLEMIERREATVFAETGLHHIGVWCDDPAEESVRLEGEGWPRESVNLTPEGEWAGALYHLGTCGLRVEMVDIARSGPRLCRYLAGGDYT
jgi:hypothetical protein